MVRSAKRVLPVLLLAYLCLALLPAAASEKPRSPRARSGKVKVQPPPPAPAVPAPPPTPQQLPPNPPQVSYRDGLLTIHAQNSTLADILAAVRAQTGATIDMPAQGGSERVFFHQGPAPARDVLAALLNGSSFDYILLGSLERPGALQSVLLLPKPAGAGTTAAAAPPPAPAVVNPNPDLDESGDEGAPDESEPVPAQPAPEQVVPTPSPQPKTPEQLLEELRQQQLRMQQQQQQQQQNPPPQPPNTQPQ